MYPDPDLLSKDVWFSPSHSKLVCPYNDGYVKLTPADIPSIDEVIAKGWEDYIK